MAGWRMLEAWRTQFSSELDAATAMFRPATADPDDIVRRSAALLCPEDSQKRSVRCPRCGSVQVKHWGRLLDRPRYLCKACRRTFNPSTCTPWAYSKHQAKWPEASRCLVDGLSVRRTAERLGIHPSTAFRWRHRLLASLIAREPPILAGIVEVAEFYYPDCRKGERRLPRPPRRRGIVATRFSGQAAVCVILARDRQGGKLTGVAGPGVPGVWAVSAVLCPSLSEGSVLCTEGFYWYRDFCRRAGVAHRMANGLHQPWIPRQLLRQLYESDPEAAVYHIRKVVHWRHKLKGWLKVFRGVASKYLERYLAWFRFVDGARRLSRSAAAEMLLTSSGLARGGPGMIVGAAA